MLTIGIIDNYELMRLGLINIIQRHFATTCTLESNSFDDFLIKHAGKKPDLVIIGINLWVRKDSLATVSHIRRKFPDTLIIVYDELLPENLSVPYFQAGANGYILKQNSLTDLIHCVKTVLGGNRYLSPLLMDSFLNLFFKPNNNLSGQFPLTDRESEIAAYLSQGKKTSWIATTLGRKPSTISTIKNNIFKKMKVDNVVELKRIISFDLT